MKPWCACLVLVGCTNLDPDCPPNERPTGTPDVRVISYNIGNGLKEAPYELRVRDLAYEAHLGAQIRARGAHVVMLQEVLPPTVCESYVETDPGRACHASAADQHPAQAKRLLGDAYSVVCDQRDHVECIGVRVDFGTIRGVAPGGFELAGAETAPLPGPACDFTGGECDGSGDNCDAESSVSTVIIDTVDGPLQVIHGHPTAIGESCLQEQINQSFELAEGFPTILGGDWNFDPTRADDLAATTIWSTQVGVDRRFTDHSSHRRACRLTRTSVGQDASLDRIASDFAEGGCFVWQNPRLDDGYDFDTLDGGRADHYAVECELFRRTK